MNQLSIFKSNCPEQNKAIFVHGLKQEIKEIINHLGKPILIAKQLGVKYTKLKEWPTGRKPISLQELNALLNFCENEFRKNMMDKIDYKEILLSTKYSPHKVKMPKETSEDLSYVIGLILEDGHVAGDSLNKNGNWIISVFFDNKEHRTIYSKIIEKEFGLICKHILHKPNCFQATICSRALHFILRNYYTMHNGYKAHKIEIPENILREQELIKAALIQGLFDSDGTITNGYIKYSTVSKKMINQAQQTLLEMNINSSITIWIKDKKYQPLYTLSIKSISKIIFAEKIGFRHPLKKLALDKLFNSPLV